MKRNVIADIYLLFIPVSTASNTTRPAPSAVRQTLEQTKQAQGAFFATQGPTSDVPHAQLTRLVQQHKPARSCHRGYRVNSRTNYKQWSLHEEGIEVLEKQLFCKNSCFDRES
jgi:hypothetical protein